MAVVNGSDTWGSQYHKAAIWSVLEYVTSIAFSFLPVWWMIYIVHL